MDADRWQDLSRWHNAWLDADPGRREEIRLQLAREHPDISAEVAALADASDRIDGFLDTPAFVLAAQDLAHQELDLPQGTIVGPYRVVSLIARGGMSTVYRATDVRLLRDVALKVLGPSSGNDLQRTERFLQEARVTAALDHPNIVKVYDVGLFRGWPYIVEEWLDGETLRHRLEGGALALPETERIAEDLVRGLVAAHGAGLVHRDLKPENVFVTSQGVTKVLDFGIAKMGVEPMPTGVATLPGVLLGTAGYLAPEQVRGDTVDARADLFALGAILFEMLTGHRAFAREHTIDTLHAIVHEPPPSVLDLRADAPGGLVAITARLLQKAPHARFQSASDLSWAFEHVDGHVSRPVRAEDASRRPAQLRRRWAIAAGVTAGVLVGALAVMRPREPGAAAVVQTQPTTFTWALPDGSALQSPPVMSPDGRRVLFASIKEGSPPVLMLRDLSSLAATPIPGTEGARQPFWSPDGATVGYFAGGKLMKVALRGGAPVALADAPDPRGGTWSPSGVIVFQPDYRDSGLLRVPASGGVTEPVVGLDLTRGDTTLRWPMFLPDGVHFVYSLGGLDPARRGVYVGSAVAATPTPTRLLYRTEGGAVLAPSAIRGQALLISPLGERAELRALDLVTLTIVGDARTFDLPAATMTPHLPSLLAASGRALAFATVPVPAGTHEAFVDRTGERLDIWPDQVLGGFPRYSPSGDLLARTLVDHRSNDGDIWIEDLVRRTSMRVTNSRELQVMPVWSPDGRRVAYRSGPVRSPHLAVSSADGRGDVTSIPCPGAYCEPTDWSAGGRFLVANVDNGVWRVPVDPGTPATPLIEGAFVTRDARLSPDGRWLAYVSYQSGHAEAVVRSMTGNERHFVVSSRGGDQPAWRRDGRELYYVSEGGQLFAVPVSGNATDELRFGVPTRMEVPRFGERHWGTVYDVSPDGTRVTFPHPGPERPPAAFTVILDWHALVP